MMLTLYGLPHNFHYKDVKALIRSQCLIADFILDNLSVEAGFKKIRVGLATDTEGNQLMKCLDGLKIQGCTVKVVPTVKTLGASEPAPIDTYQRDTIQPSYNPVQPSPWINQEASWPGNQMEPQGTYQHFPQNQTYAQPQPQQSIPIVNREVGNRFQTQENYEKPITIMKDNFQGPQYVPQQTQPAPFETTQPPWTPHMQQGQQFNQVSSTNQLIRQGNRQLRECEVRPDSNEAGFNKVSHSQYGSSSNRQVSQQMTGRRVSPDREMSTGRREIRRTSPGRNQREQRVSPSKGMGHVPDRRRDFDHNRRMSPVDHHLPSGRPVLLSGRYDSPSGQVPSDGHVLPAGHQMPPGGRRISPPGRQMPQGGRHISPPGRQMPQGRRHFSPPGRQMPPPGRQISHGDSLHISPPGRQMPQGGRHISPPGRQIPPDGRHISPPRRQIPQGGRHFSPPRRQMPQGGRHISPPGRQMPPGGRHISPPGRQMPPGGRYISPPRQRMPQSGQHISPIGQQLIPQGVRPISPSGRHISPPGRQMPQGRRHFSPPGRQIPPPGRQISHGDSLHISPHGRQMPQGGRHISPPGRQVTQGSRHISPPGRQMLPPGRQIPQDGRHISPPGRQIPPGGRNISPPGRQIPQGGRHISPPGRQMVQVSPSGRQVLLSAPPTGRQLLQGRLGSPPGRLQMSQQDPPTNRHVPPNGRQRSPLRQDGRQLSPSGRRISPTWRRNSPSARQVPIHGRKISPSGRFSPPGRTVLINERRISPGRRAVQMDRPGPRQMSPNRSLIHDRRGSPSRAMPSGRAVLPGRRISPSERRVSPGRRLSPSGRRPSPPGRLLHQPSPDIRRDSTMHQDSRQHMRYSPQHKGPMGKYDQADSRSTFKQAISLYDKASDQAMFSSGFQSNIREDKPYPRTSPARVSRWQEREQVPSRNADRSLGPHKTDMNRFSEQRMAEEQRKKSRSLTRESVRDRSPIRAPKRHSPSPRSPRRSWALEKRNSPDIKEAPPPPIWPGQDPHFQRPDRPHYSGGQQKEDPWQHKMEERHQARSSFGEKDCISNWKPQPSDRSSQRFAEANKIKQSQQFVKDDTYYREIEKQRGFPHREDSRPNYENRHNPYKNEETSRFADHAGKGTLQKQEYKVRKETNQDFYADNRNRNTPSQTNPKYRTTPQDRNPKDYRDYGEQANNKWSDSNKEEISRPTTEKRKKVIATIATTVMEKFGCHLSGKNRQQQLVHDEVKAEVGRMFYKLYGNEDVAEGRIESDFNESKLGGIFSRSVTRVMYEIKKIRMQKAGHFNTRVNAAQAQKRPQPPPKLLPAKVTKHNETHTQINEDKVVSTKPSHAAPKQPEKPVVSAKTLEAPPKQPDKSTASVKQSQATMKQPEKSTALAKPSQATPKQQEKSIASAKPSQTTPKQPEKSIASAKPSQTTRKQPEMSIASTKPSQAATKQPEKSLAPAKSPPKPAQVEAANTQDNKAEDKSDDLTKKTDKKEADGNYSELNELMSNVLKKELRGIMDKVWSCLLDQPESPADVIAADLIRHNAVDHIRDAIGLNVAKRLLNVFNPLFVKIQFSCRPENGCLTAFLKLHNIRSFKRLPNAENTFAAQLQHVADFDALCHTKDIKCGSADLKITPHYKFTQCPPNLKLNLDDDDYYFYPDDDEDNDEEDKIDEQMFDEFDKEIPIEEDESLNPNTANDESKPESHNELKDKEKKSEESQSDSKIVENKSTPNKVSNITPNKDGAKSLSEMTSNVKSTVANAKEMPSKNVSDEKAQSKDKKQNDTSQVTETIAKSKNEEVNKKSDKVNVPNNKNNPERKDSPNKDKSTEHKTKAIREDSKINTPKPQKRKQNVTNNEAKKKYAKTNPKRKTYEVIDEAYDDIDDENEDEELGDEDILALLSGGVVLDECGSDDD